MNKQEYLKKYIKLCNSNIKDNKRVMALLKSFGINPADKKLIALKSSFHYRADFESIAKKIIEVDTPGVHSPDLFQYDYKKLRRPIFPMDNIWAQ